MLDLISFIVRGPVIMTVYKRETALESELHVGLATNPLRGVTDRVCKFRKNMARCDQVAKPCQRDDQAIDQVTLAICSPVCLLLLRSALL